MPSTNLLFTCTVLGWCVVGIVGPPVAGDTKALQDLYTATFNKNIGNIQTKWNKYTNWMSGDACTWQGITCTGNRVTRVQLYGNNLRGGPLPDSFRGLSELKTLDLGANAITGELPNNLLKQMTKLEFLRLGNRVVGTFPDWTASKEKLTFVSMNGRGFSGTLPLAYLDLPRIEDFRLYYTSLTGTIPSFDGLRNAKHIRFYDNRYMKGVLPPVDKLTRVESFRVAWNGLSGTLPPFDSFTRIVSLRLFRNSLSGTLPVLPTKALDTLEYLTVEENALQEVGLYTPVPSPGVFKKLWYLNTGENILTGTIPCHRTAFPALTEWRADNNFLTGTIPCLDNLAGLTTLQLAVNSFTGTLPDTAPAGITTLDLRENKLSGTIPSGFVNNLLAAKTINLAENRFSGTIPEMPQLPSLEALYLHRNSHWTEAVPVQVEPQDFFDLAMDNDSTTIYERDPGFTVLLDFGSEVCVEAMVTTFPMTVDTSLPVTYRTEGVVRDLRLYQGNKGFSAAETTECVVYRTWSADRAWRVNVPGGEHVVGRRLVHDDHLNCWAPYCQNPTRYYRLDVTNCHTSPCKLPEWHFYTGERLSGTIPSFEGLTSLDTLHLYGNDLTGTLPDLAHSKWDGSLRVEDNRLSGFNNTEFCPYFAKLNELRFDHNEITGTIPQWDCMREVVKLSVGDNPLTGTLPAVVSSQLKYFYAENVACCKYWERERLYEAAHTRRSLASQDCPRCGKGLEGHLLKWTGVPNLEDFLVQNNGLSGTIGDVSVLTRMETFNVQSNELGGTLPYRELVVAGNSTTSCDTTTWYFSNNTLWGPVPDLKQPLGTRKCDMGYCRCGRHTHTNDGRKLFDLQFDNNYLWGPAPTNVERTIRNVVYDENCWDCPLLPKAVWNASCLLGTPCISDNTKRTWTSPEPTGSSGYGSEKSLTRPPVCTEPPAERFTFEGPSCAPNTEPPVSLYEHVSRCQTELFLDRTITEEEVRSGFAPLITVNFTPEAVLPFFAPTVFECGLPEVPGPLGPRGWDFTLALREAVIAGTTSGGWEPMGWNSLRPLLVGAGSLSMQGTHPYIDFPTEMVLDVGSGSGYDISTSEVVTMRVGRELLLTPFGPQVNDVWFTIIPTEGQVVGANLVVNETTVKEEGVEVRVTLEEGETWDCGECMVAVPAGVEEDWNGADEKTEWMVAHTRTCSWGCAVPQAGAPFVTTCPDNHTMVVTVRLPDYNLNEVQTETIDLSFPPSCFKSGLQANDANYTITIKSVVEPTPTVTLTGTDTVTNTATQSLTTSRSLTTTDSRTRTATPSPTATVSLTQTETASLTATATLSSTSTLSMSAVPTPFCMFYSDSALCTESRVEIHTFFLFTSLLLVGVLSAAAFWVFCARRPPKMECSVSRIEVSVECPPPVVNVNVNKVPLAGIDVRVRRVGEPMGGGEITVTARKAADVTLRPKAPSSTASGSTINNPLLSTVSSVSWNRKASFDVKNL